MAEENIFAKTTTLSKIYLIVVNDLRCWAVNLRLANAFRCHIRHITVRIKIFSLLLNDFAASRALFEEAFHSFSFVKTVIIGVVW